jgi:simple sugar transport system ATP-binding protein
METVPFKLALDAPVSSLAAGEKQKVEILKQLYLKRRCMILDEPTSVLTPQEADEVLGMLRDMARRGEVSVLLITHKFREVMAFSDRVTVRRRGKLAGEGEVAALTPAMLAEMMVGTRQVAGAAAPRARRSARGQPVRLALRGLHVEDDAGLPAVSELNLEVRAGEIVGVAGVSGNGQRELVEALIGQREVASGAVSIDGQPYRATRAQINRHRVFSLPEEPLRNACVGMLSVADNMGLRNFDRPPVALGPWLRRWLLRAQSRRLISEYKVKTPGPDAPMRTLSGGNVQRAVLARELSGDVSTLIVANPVFGLDFAAVAEIHDRILAARDAGAAVLLVSEDLDELLELSDRLVVMFDGRIVYETTPGEADIGVIGRHMAGHAEADRAACAA